MAKLGLTASFGGLSLGLVASPSIDPEDYLDICSESIGTWWQWLDQGHYHKVERVLLKHTPILKRLAYTASPFQGMAAGLAARAKIMQIMIATNRLDFVGCKTVCADAVRLGALSGNYMLLAVALDWQGNTYTNFYHQPQTAIHHLNDALSKLNSESSSLIRSAIYSDLSNAYAQEGDEDEARKYVELAHMVMPKAI